MNDILVAKRGKGLNDILVANKLGVGVAAYLDNATTVRFVCAWWVVGGGW